ncbi:transposable element Tcb2 transposase [Trichonephila clavipes]|nr:transposable element Tcb2 transposase [Trichonephila clavipes]
MEARWSSRRVSSQLNRYDCVVRRCLDQWIRDMSITRRPGSGRPQQTSLREDRHIVRNACLQTTASSAAIETHVAPSLGAPVSSRTIQRHLAKGHMGSWRSLRKLLMTPPLRHLHLEWCRARGNWTAAEWNKFVFNSRFNLSNVNRVRL